MMQLELNDQQQALLEEKIQTAQTKSQKAEQLEQQLFEAQAAAQQAQERALGLMEAWTAAEGLDVDVEELEYEDGALTSPNEE